MDGHNGTLQRLVVVPQSSADLPRRHSTEDLDLTRKDEIITGPQYVNKRRLRDFGFYF